MLFLLIIMEFSIYTLQFVKIFFVSTHQVEGEEHDWEYHATVFVYITSPHAEDLQNNQSLTGRTRANMIRVRKKTKAPQIARCLRPEK